MWTKIPQMCFRIHFREGRTAKLHSWKKFQRSQLPSFSVSFPPSIQSCYIHPRILASFSSLFMIHPEFWEQGGISDYYSQLPNLCFQLLSKHLCCLIPLFCQSARKEAVPHCTFLLQIQDFCIATPLIFVPWKHFVCTKSLLLKFEKSATRTGSWRGFFFICNPLLHFHRLVVLENSRDASAPKHSNVSELRELLWWCLQTHCEDNDLPTTSAFSAKSPCFHYFYPIPQP